VTGRTFAKLARQGNYVRGFGDDRTRLATDTRNAAISVVMTNDLQAFGIGLVAAEFAESSKIASPSNGSPSTFSRSWSSGQVKSREYL
jgi:hypothetical protein